MSDGLTDEQAKELAQGCLMVISFAMTCLFASLAVGFIFGAGYGFMTAAIIALLQHLAACFSAAKAAKAKQ